MFMGGRLRAALRPRLQILSVLSHRVSGARKVLGVSTEAAQGAAPNPAQGLKDAVTLNEDFF